MMPTPTELLAILEVLDAAGVPGGGASPSMLLARVTCLALENERLTCLLDAEGRKSDVDRLLERLDEDDGLVLAKLSDAYAELGQDEVSRAWGYLWQTGRWPVRHKVGWRWYNGTIDPFACRLPITLFLQLRNGIPDTDNSMKYETRHAAFEDVVDAIASGRWKEQPAG